MKRQKQSQEDYLRTLYILWEKDKNIHSKKIADYLNISKPSVSAMLNKLQQKKYINKKPYGTVNLTKKGLVKAKEITRRHRLIEVFLKKSLGLKNENIHQEAHHLEHAFSDLSIKKLEKILKNPKKCPHGKKIPK
ncbi:MAG: metal-dependent transcriptional regulator [Patescibacteria group bacterium]|nr:metal-dependent transcriptional regulator [Patescibacteria group bacterium]